MRSELAPLSRRPTKDSWVAGKAMKACLTDYGVRGSLWIKAGELSRDSPGSFPTKCFNHYFFLTFIYCECVCIHMFHGAHVEAKVQLSVFPSCHHIDPGGESGGQAWYQRVYLLSDLDYP